MIDETGAGPEHAAACPGPVPFHCRQFMITVISELCDAMIVYRITLQYVLFEHGVCPLAELYAAF